MKSIFDYPEIIKRLADALFLNIEKYDDDLYRKFFVERVEDAEFLDSRLNEVQSYGGNVLVVGEPGVGKTNFLKWFLKRPEFLQIAEVNSCTLLDLTTTPYTEENHQTFISNLEGKLADAIVTHLGRLGDPCHDITPDNKTPISQEARYNYCASKLGNSSILAKSLGKQIHYVFLDDVDYMPARCFIEVLEYLKPLLFSRYFCVIIACRTPAFNTIKSHRDYTVSRAFDDAKLVRLEPLPVHSVLQARIKTLTSEGRSIRTILTSQLSKTSLRALLEFFRSVISGLEPTDDIELFEYPFTEKQHAFMRMMTNGNIRHILLMAQEYLHYMRSNKGSLRKEEHGYWVGRSAVIRHFINQEINPKIRIQNLHEKKTCQYMTAQVIKEKGIQPRCVGNSIAVVLLETYKQFQYPNRLDAQYVRSLFEEYGLIADDVRQGTVDLIDYGLIRERVLSARPALGAKTSPKDYDLTEKGECYLNYLIHWDEYIELFGVSRHHKEFRTFETSHAVEASLLQFLINILVVKRKILDRKALDTLTIPKGPFRSQFCKLNRDLIRHLDPTDKLTSHEITEHDITDYLTTWLQVIKVRSTSEGKPYEFKHDGIEGLARERGLPLAVTGIYDRPAFEKFVRTFTR